MRSVKAILPFLVPAINAGVVGSWRCESNGPCVVTQYSELAGALASCSYIVIRDVDVPPNSSLDFSSAKPNTMITFEGTTSFGFTNSSSFNPIQVGGTNITVRGAPGSIINGNGQYYWDGLGSNGGVPKPDHFVLVKNLEGGAIENLHIVNYPVHCFFINYSNDITVRNIFLDNSAGYAPNSRSNGLPAAHNTDGFDVSACNNLVIENNFVINQDDCVAITSGDQIIVRNMECHGSHGLSIGSVGGKLVNNVTNIHFSNSACYNCHNGARVKTNYNTTGFVANITYEDIRVYNISHHGIDVQQDYLNGGPTGIPSNGVIIDNLLFKNIVGTMDPSSPNGYDYYILCGDGSCNNFVFEDVHITGGAEKSSCNYPPSGCP